MLAGKKCWSKKMLAEKIFGSKKVWVKKNVGQKKIGLKKMWVKKVWVKFFMHETSS